jgi:hypothetical protein
MRCAESRPFDWVFGSVRQVVDEGVERVADEAGRLCQWPTRPTPPPPGPPPGSQSDQGGLHRGLLAVVVEVASVAVLLRTDIGVRRACNSDSGQSEARGQ